MYSLQSFYKVPMQYVKSLNFQGLSKQVPENSQGLYKLPDNSQGLYKLPDNNFQGLYKLPENSQGLYKLPEISQGLCKLVVAKYKGFFSENNLMLLLNQGPLNHRKVLNPSVIGVQKYIYKPFLLNFFISWFYQY